MDVPEYLKKYNRNEDMILKWIRENGHDPVVASMIIETFAHEDKEFPGSHELDHAIMNETREDESRTIKEVLNKHRKHYLHHLESKEIKIGFWKKLWEKIKKLWHLMLGL